MAQFTLLRYGFSFSYLFVLSFSLNLIAIPISSSTPLNNIPNFEPEISLLGDAQLIDGGSCVKLTRPSASSSGLLLRRKPFRFVDHDLRNPISFSTSFTFSISPGNGDGLILVLVPRDFGSRFSGVGEFGLSRENSFLGIEFDTEKNDNVGDLDANHIGVDVGSFVSVSVGNVSSINLLLNGGEKLKTWIDYDASSKRIEVRLGKSGEPRPYNPIIAYAIDLAAMWGDKNIFVGISSSNGNSLQISSVYSWDFRLRNAPNWMHSLPVDPRAYSDEHGKHVGQHKRRICPLTILGGLILGTGCGALMAFVVLVLWVSIVHKNTVFPVVPRLHSMDIRYEKIGIVVEKDAAGVQNYNE